MSNVELKTLNYFCFLVYELPFLTQFPHIAPTGPNTFLNRYNLTLQARSKEFLKAGEVSAN